uniref:Nucleoside diphosphate kinase-like domain-containing protein n=1 Tax=Esox lucius TaxID=8010 RepID=A0AAY5L6N0_ESOLU
YSYYTFIYKLQIEVSNEEQWKEALLAPGLLVVDVYQRWCGPCKAVQNIFRKCKTEYGDDLLRFAVAEADDILELSSLKGKCLPVCLFYSGGKLLSIVRGVNGPLLQKTILELVDVEKKKQQLGSKYVPEVNHGTYCVVIIKPDAVAGGQVEAIRKKVSASHWILTQYTGYFRCLFWVISLRSNYVQEVDMGLSDCSIEMDSRQLAFFFPTLNVTSDTQAGSISEIQKTLALIRPSLLRKRKDEILKTIHDFGFQIAMQREITLTDEQAKEFYKDHDGTDYFPGLINQMTSGPLLALALTREDAVLHWRGLLGPKVVDEAKEKSPESLRAQFAIDNVAINQLHGSSTPEEAQRDLNKFFPTEHTLAVIKPDYTQELRDSIINRIKEAGFSISQVTEKKLTRDMAEEFYKDHVGKYFYNHLVDYMSRGPSVMMILSKENAITEWREMMGPTDPEQAKQGSPNCLRAQFAKSILENVVHGSSNVQHAMDNIMLIFGDIPKQTLLKKEK